MTKEELADERSPSRMRGRERDEGEGNRRPVRLTFCCHWSSSPLSSAAWRQMSTSIPSSHIYSSYFLKALGRLVTAPKVMESTRQRMGNGRGLHKEQISPPDFRHKEARDRLSHRSLLSSGQTFTEGHRVYTAQHVHTRYT